jgi:hypothetical protein
MRRSLDYLIYELAFLDTGSEKNGTQFPIDDSPNVFWARTKRSKGGPAPYLKDLKRGHTAAIERSQPYKGVDWSEDLRAISNPDKHRHLTVAGGEERTTAEHIPRPDGSEDPAYQEVIPTEDGFTVLWTISDRMDVKLHVTIYVAFEDKLGVMETLQQIKAEVADLLHQFDPCFSGKCHH